MLITRVLLCLINQMSDGVPPWLVDDPKEIAALWSAVEGITFTDDQPPTTEEINQECRPFTNEEWDLYKKTLEESEECVYYIYPIQYLNFTAHLDGGIW